MSKIQKKALFYIFAFGYALVLVGTGLPIQLHAELWAKLFLVIFSWHLIYANIFNTTMFLRAANCENQNIRSFVRVVGLLLSIFCLGFLQYQGLNYYK